MDITSEIDKLKHFHVENYSGTNFTDDLNDGEEFLYTTIRCKDDKEVTLLCKYVKNKHIGNCPFNTCLLYEHDIDKGWMPKETIYIDCVEVEISPDNWIMSVDADNTDLLILSCNYSIQWKKYTEAIYKYRTNTGKMTASDYTHLFGYLNPYYRSAYNIPKRRK